MREAGVPGPWRETTTQFYLSKPIFPSPAILLTITTTSFHANGNIVVKVLSFGRVKRASVSTVIDPAGSFVGRCCPAGAGSVEGGSSHIKTQEIPLCLHQIR
jgi:hypothetical protein